MTSIDSLHPRFGRAALLMIEFVNEWLATDGKLHRLMERNRAAFDDSVAVAQRVLHAARAIDMPVLHATLKLSPDYRELGACDFGLRGAIQRAGTWKSADDGWRFHPDFAPAADEFVVEGRSGSSAFADSNLDRTRPGLRTSDRHRRDGGLQPGAAGTLRRARRASFRSPGIRRHVRESHESANGGEICLTRGET
ncbi:MAG: isochorismatase family protein [Acidihalobacter sp.]